MVIHRRLEAGWHPQYDYIGFGFYSRAIDAYRKAVGGDRMKVFLFDDLKNDPLEKDNLARPGYARTPAQEREFTRLKHKLRALSKSEGFVSQPGFYLEICDSGILITQICRRDAGALRAREQQEPSCAEGWNPRQYHRVKRYSCEYSHASPIRRSARPSSRWSCSNCLWPFGLPLVWAGKKGSC